MHRLLQHQLKGVYGRNVELEKLSEHELRLIESIDEAYENNDRERKFLEHTLELNSNELNQRNREAQQALRQLKEAHEALEKERGQLAYRVEQRTLELSTALKMAEQASRAKTQFLATMSHEVRTPLNGILGMTQLLADTRLVDEQLDFVNTIKLSGDSLLSLINDILDFSKLEANMVRFEKIVFNLERVCQECLDLVAGKAVGKHLDFVLDYEPESSRFFSGDPSRIRQILLNLLGNAVKFTEKGYICLNLSEEQDGDQRLIHISVEDTGIGIEAERREHVFDEFTQVDQSTSRRFGGTGLGLAITKKLVMLMDGNIGVESIPGAGSRFWFDIRLDVAEPPAAPGDVSLRDVPVLLVSGDLRQRRVFERMIIHLGARVSLLDDMAGVMATLNDALGQENPYRILVLDHEAGPIDSIELGARIRADSRFDELKMLEVYSPGNKGDVARIEQAGFDAFLSRLCRAEVLHRMLSSMLEKDAAAPIITQHSIEDALNKSSADETNRFQARVLVVDDVEVNLIIARKFLEKMGVTVDLAGDGREALQKYEQNEYDLVFMDCMMPVMDGYAAAGAIREREQRGGTRTPIIALTANASHEDIDVCIGSGMDDVVNKPIKMKELSDSMARWLKPDASKM